MSLAIQEGQLGLGRVHPNPPVGCVVLDKNGEFLVSARHEVFGGNHAEINALEKIGDLQKLEGSTWYVTLEPCAHEAKTPSCAKALAKLPIAKVVYGLTDPNPKVSGQGLKVLSDAGIEVEEFKDLKLELEELAEVFLWNQRKKQVFVALKLASSLDGHVAHSSGESQWLTSEKSRSYNHYLRACYDAVAVGAGTIKTDNPKLNIRHPDFTDKKNKVVVFDMDGESFDTSLELFQVREPRDIFWVSTEKNKNDIEAAGAIWVQANKLDFVLKQLFDRGITSLYVEGGADLFGSFLKEECVQRMYQFIAPVILGSKGVNWTKSFSIEQFSNRVQLNNSCAIQIDKDLLFTGRLILNLIFL